MHQIAAWFGRATPVGLLSLAVLVGLGSAIGAALFHALIALTTGVFYGDLGGNFLGRLAELPTWQRLLIPTAGGFLVGLVFSIAKVSEAEGEGVPEVVEALAVHKGKIRPVVAPVKIITAALTLGSGGSAGREGPVIQIGSAIGSSVAQLFLLPTREQCLLLAAGAAAAIGGTFGAPLAGILFTIEILRHRPRVFYCIVITLAALIGTLGTQLLTGYEGLRFMVGTLPEFTAVQLAVFAIVIGLLASLTAVSFGFVLRGAQLTFAHVPVPRLVRPALGGFLIGCVGLFLPYIHEPAAYPLMVDLMTLSLLPLGLLVTLLLVKMLATGITLGSGGSGGIFAPSLLIGTIVGSIVGIVFLQWGLVALEAVPLFVVLGMAAVFAGAAHAPLTATVITYEMTGELSLIVPLLMTCLVAWGGARMLRTESIYHEQS